MRTPTQVVQDVFRILLYRNHANELLVELTPDGLLLPTLSVRQRTRVTEGITAAIESHWGVESFALFPLPPLASPGDPIRYHVVESCQIKAAPPAGMQWLPVISLLAGDFRESQDSCAIQQSTRMLDQFERGELTGAFGKSGWLQPVMEWVEASATMAGLCLTGKFRQLNASPTFSLLRFETDGPALWFKAVGEPNVQEFRITLELARCFREFVTSVLASHERWNAWLSMEMEGQHPAENSDVGVWMTIARNLARLQIASLGQSLHLINAGCRDARASALARQIDPFMETMAELMAEQVIASPPPLSRKELYVLREQLHRILSDWRESGTFNALCHLDFNPGNILVCQQRSVFLDWAEAAVGPPFLTFQYLIEHFGRLRPAEVSLVRQLTSAYVHPWASLLEPREIARALALSPLLAVLSHALSMSTWRDPQLRHRREFAGYLRSVTRRMKREADILFSREPGRCAATRLMEDPCSL